jgi:Ca2+-transporting ATPase
MLSFKTVRNLPSVETLGCVSIIATDKTGTLTTNQMTAVALVTLDRNEKGTIMFEHSIEGETYEPIGKVEGMRSDEISFYSSGAISDVMAVSLGCNDAQLIKKSDRFSIIGEPTEGALLTLAEKLGANDDEVVLDKCRQMWHEQWDRYATLDFDRNRKSMSILCRDKSTKVERLLVKGAPNLLLERCTHAKLRDGTVVEMTSDLRNEYISVIKDLSSRPLRCLLLAVKEVDSGQYQDELRNVEAFGRIESGLTACGIVGMVDPPRRDALESIRLCKQAGIRIAMITGDAKDTAISIAQELHILPSGSRDSLKAFEGKQFFLKPEQEQRLLLGSENLVFYRTEPSDKQKIVKMLQLLGEIIAMTGDGVNDAPALRQANIGKRKTN